MKVKMLENEYWWGGIVDFGAEMPYDKNSCCTIDLNADGSDQRMPVYLSNMGRYILSDRPFKITFKNGYINIEDDGRTELGEGYENLRGAHKAIAEKLFSKTDTIPDESFFRVPQYNTWIEMMYNQNQMQILEYAHSIVDHGMTAGILMIDEGWSEDYGIFDFYPGRFEDPKAMLDELHSLGFKVMLWITPYISPDSHAFRELRDTDFLIKDHENHFAIREWWNGYSCVLDLSNPSACEWLNQKLKGIMEKYPVDGFKFDAGDPCMYRDDDKTYFRQPTVAHTQNYDIFASQYTFNELRAVWNMGGEPIVCRLQDKLHSWDNHGLNCIIPNTLLQGLLGYYYGCPDMIGGGDYSSFLDKNFCFDEELYIRWLQASILCPMLQFSIAPWRVLSEEKYKIVKTYVKFRERFAAYIIELARNAAKRHEPIIRYMEYEFPHQGYEKVNNMFMLGDRYLVVPMLEKGKTERTIRLPAGKWEEIGGKTYDGGKDVTLKYFIEKLYVFERKESLYEIY